MSEVNEYCGRAQCKMDYAHHHIPPSRHGLGDLVEAHVLGSMDLNLLHAVSARIENRSK